MMNARRRNRTATPHGGPVGTEAKAVNQMKENAKNFKYPPNGFATRVEHTLLYAMINEPTVFPEDAVVKVIQEERFEQYLYERPDKSSSITDAKVSYGQLSALLARSGEGWSSDSEVPQAMCKEITKCVIRYSEQNGLDRQSETDELLQPIIRMAEIKGGQNSLAIILPAYAGLAISLATGNPLPMIISSVVMNAATAGVMAKEGQTNENIEAYMKSSNRMADVEQASLLDEYTEDQYDD